MKGTNSDFHAKRRINKSITNAVEISVCKAISDINARETLVCCWRALVIGERSKRHDVEYSSRIKNH